jgi:hypothetical protein
MCNVVFCRLFDVPQKGRIQCSTAPRHALHAEHQACGCCNTLSVHQECAAKVLNSTTKFVIRVTGQHSGAQCMCGMSTTEVMQPTLTCKECGCWKGTHILFDAAQHTVPLMEFYLFSSPSAADSPHYCVSRHRIH